MAISIFLGRYQALSIGAAEQVIVLDWVRANYRYF